MELLTDKLPILERCPDLGSDLSQADRDELAAMRAEAAKFTQKHGHEIALNSISVWAEGKPLSFNDAVDRLKKIGEIAAKALGI
jgi:hypothetical protein